MGTEDSRVERPIKDKSNFEKTYVIDGEPITVTWKVFTPESGVRIPSLGTFIFPGWAAGDAKTLEELAQCFAEESGGKTYSVTTRTKRVLDDSIYKEAKAVCQMVDEQKIERRIFAGHSRGGALAGDVVVVSQTEYPEGSIEGLILFDPVGLYQQGKGELAGKFAWDTLVSTPVSVWNERAKYPEGYKKVWQAGWDVASKIPKQLVPPKRIFNQIGEMAQENPHYKEVGCPVVIIQGEGDPVSSPERTVPDQEARQLWSTRRRFLKEDKFPNSPDVSMLVAQKFPRHGLPHFRPEEVAKTSLYLLNRHQVSKGPNLNPESKFIKK